MDIQVYPGYNPKIPEVFFQNTQHSDLINTVVRSHSKEFHESYNLNRFSTGCVVRSEMLDQILILVYVNEYNDNSHQILNNKIHLHNRSNYRYCHT